jgi:uncharacterized glyoxalase superfamily protein PhnB
MTNYARQCKSTVIPGLYYRNAKLMIEWLCDTFGFERQLVVPGPEDIVMHSQLTFGNGMIMIGSSGSGSPNAALTGFSEESVRNEMLSLLVSDCTEIYAKAKSAGAIILSELEKKDFGGEAFTCRDPEGHIWNFSTHDPWET